MSVFSVSLRDSNRVKNGSPKEKKKCSRLDIIDVCGGEDDRLFLSSDGKVYKSGFRWLAGEIEEGKYARVSGIPDDLKAIDIKVDEEVGQVAILMENGSVYAAGSSSYLPRKMEEIFPAGSADHIAVSSSSVAFSKDSKITVWSIHKQKEVDLKGRKVVSIYGDEDCYVVLLDDGIVYYCGNTQSRVIESDIDDLKIMAGCCGLRAIYMTVHRREMCIIYCDGTIVHYNFNSDDYNPEFVATLPPTELQDKVIVDVHCARDWIWILLSTGKGLFISKIEWLSEDKRKVGRVNKWSDKYPEGVKRLGSDWNNLYLFQNGEPRVNISLDFKPGNIQDRSAPYTTHIDKLGCVTIDPCGVYNIGFKYGDIVSSPDGDHLIVLGSHEDYLCVKSTQKCDIVAIPKPSIQDSLFKWRVENRMLGDLQEITLGDGITSQIDCSEMAIKQLCSFKPGDIIRHRVFGEGTVVGERCGFLWIKYGDKYRMYKGSDSYSIHRDHEFVSRKDASVTVLDSISGSIHLVEQIGVGELELGCIVESKTYGLGKYRGNAESIIVSYLADGGLCRTDYAKNLTLKRSQTSRVVQMWFIDETMASVDISEAACSPYGIVPCDIIQFDGQIATCIGLSQIDGEASLIFETETMIKHDIGVGAFCTGKVPGAVFIARVGIPGTVTYRLENGKEIELSVNTDDFIQSPFMPGDRLMADDKVVEVRGISDDVLYVQIGENEYVEPIPESECKLVYRRLGIPTRCIAAVGSGFIDLEHCRNHRFLPGETASINGSEVTVVGTLDNQCIICRRESQACYVHTLV